ncbi:unnamed protein product [Staurois parvus]|uniref:Uncharacterized protein n=1 Tax=Staurois parvus TaxID=386267 RepID=A0ABN9CQU0_9NEOB|nr:unnamed protein product [Staurois parvus]
MVWSTDRLTPPTPSPSAAMLAALISSIFQRQPLLELLTLSTCTHLLWVDHGEACVEWNLSCYTAVWSWPPCCQLQASFRVLAIFLLA